MPEPTTFDLEDLAECMTVSQVSQLPFIKLRLEEAGIPYVIEDEGVQQLVGIGSLGMGYNPLTGAPKVLVNSSRLEEAKELLGDLAEDMEAGAAASDGGGEPLRCGRCGKGLEREEGDPAVTHCFHCGAPLESS